MDDASLVVYNPRVHSLSQIPRMFLGTAFFDPLKSDNSGGQFYRPLASVSYAIIYSIAGATPWIFHFFQITLQVINTFLVLLVLRKFLSPKLALVLSLIFAIHPIFQSTVVYISSLNDILYLLFGLLALNIVIYSSSLTFKPVFLFSFLLLASLLSKETGLLFVIINFTYLWLFRRKNLLFMAYIFLYFAIFYVFLRFALAKVTYVSIPDIPIMRAAFMERFYTMPKIFFYYLSTFIFPNNLISAQWWTVSIPNFSNFILPGFLDLTFVVLLTSLGFSLFKNSAKKLPVFIFFAIWFFCGVGLHMQLIPLDWTVLDTWFYFPGIALLALIGLAWERFKLSYLLFIPILVIFSIRTVVRNADWRDGITLFTHDLKLEDNGYMQAALAGEYMQAGLFAKAVPHWQKSLQQNPWGTLVWYNLGYSYEKLGDLPNAQKNYAKFITILDPPVAYESLITVRLKMRDYSQDTQKLSQLAVSKYPDNSRLWLLKSISEYLSGDSLAASVSATKSFDLLPTVDADFVKKQIAIHGPIDLSE